MNYLETNIVNASIRNDIETVIKLLLWVGHDVYPQIIANACVYGYTEIVNIMMPYIRMSDLTNACIHGHADIVKNIVVNNTLMGDFQYPMLWSAFYGHVEIVKLLMKLPVSNIEEIIKYSIIGGNKEITRLLKESM